MTENSDVERHLLPVDSIKMMGEAVGVTNLNDDAAVKISEDLEYRLKEIIQDSGKFMRHCKRKKLICSDLDMGLKVKNVEALYGFDTAEYIPFRHASGGGKDLFYPDEQELGLLDLVNTTLPRLPSDVTVRAHWLSVEGVQPVIAENPPPITIQDQLNEATGSILPAANSDDTASHIKRISFDRKEKRKEDISTEWSKLKHLQAHALSTEQQIYFREITDACIGASDAKLQEALVSLSSDSGLYQLLPQFVSFVCEGIKFNIAQGKLIVLKHLVKVIGALLENSTLSLVNYLHIVTPSLLSALISKQLCSRPESEDHWSLRDSIGRIIGKICRKYSDTKNNIQPRIQKVLLRAVKSGHDQGLATHYGVMACLVEMGQDTIASLVVPHLKEEAALIRLVQGQPGKSAEHGAANKLQALLLRHCGPVLMATRPAGDTIAQYQSDYGSLGQLMFNQVKTLRQNRVGLQSMVTARVSSPTCKSPSVSMGKNKPPPLSFSSSLRANIGSKTQSPGTSSTPTLAAALQLVSRAAMSNPATPTTATPSLSASLLSVISSPGAHAVLTEHLTAALSGAGNGNGSSSANQSSNKS